MKKILAMVIAAIMVLVIVPFSAVAADTEWEEEAEAFYVAGVPISLMEQSYWKNDKNGSVTSDGANKVNYNIKVVPGYDSNGEVSASSAQVYFKNLDISKYGLYAEEKAAAIYVTGFSANLNITLEGKNKITMPDFEMENENANIGIYSQFFLLISGKGSLEINMGSATASCGIAAGYAVNFGEGSETIINPSEKLSKFSVCIATGSGISQVVAGNAKLVLESGQATEMSCGIISNNFGSSEEAEIEIVAGSCTNEENSVSAGIYVAEGCYNENSDMLIKSNSAAESYGIYAEKTFDIYGFTSNKIWGYSQAIKSAEVVVRYYDPDRYVGEPVPEIKASLSYDDKQAESIEYTGDGEALNNDIPNYKYVEINTVQDDDDAWYWIIEKIAEFFAKIIAALANIFSF